MKYNYLKLMIFSLGFVALNACNKTASLNGAGITVTHFLAATTINSYLTVAGAQTLAITEIRRDVPNSEVLNTPQTVTIQLNNTVITNYNTANSTSYTPLPSTAYTFDASNPLTGGNITVTFAAGEFAKPIKISIDLTNLPASPVKSAIGFTITTTSATGVIATKDAFVTVGAKNAYEASYTVTGYFFHPTTASGRAISATKAMTTLSPTRVQAAHSDLAGYFLAFDISSTNTLINYAAVGSTPAVPASGFMTMDNPAGVDFSGYAPMGPGIAPYNAATYNNTYNATAKTFWMHYGYQSGGNGEATFTRQIYEKWVRQ